MFELYVSGNVTLNFHASTGILILVNRDLKFASSFGIDKNLVLLIDLEINKATVVNTITGYAVSVSSIQATFLLNTDFNLDVAVSVVTKAVKDAKPEFALIFGSAVQLAVFLKTAALLGVNTALVGASKAMKAVYDTVKKLIGFALEQTSFLTIGVLSLTAAIFGMINLGLSFALVSVIRAVLHVGKIVGASVYNLISSVAKFAVGFATGAITNFKISASLTITLSVSGGKSLQIAANGLITFAGQVLSAVEAAAKAGIQAIGSLHGSVNIGFEFGF